MERRNHNIRFNLQNEEAKKAWEYLHTKEVEEQFKSLNAFVIIAINDYYERHLKRKADPYFETNMPFKMYRTELDTVETPNFLNELLEELI